MRRERLREAHAPEFLAQLYPEPHQHTRWGDHKIRVKETIALGRELKQTPPWRSIADLSCGDGTIALGLASTTSRVILGDYAAGYDIQGPIENTIRAIEPVELFVLCETLEHLNDPDTVLTDIRTKTDYLLLSTPEGEFASTNAEHYWGWDSEAVGAMLRAAGFLETLAHKVLDLPDFGVSYQIWGCR